MNLCWASVDEYIPCPLVDRRQLQPRLLLQGSLVPLCPHSGTSQGRVTQAQQHTQVLLLKCQILLVSTGFIVTNICMASAELAVCGLTIITFLGLGKCLDCFFQAPGQGLVGVPWEKQSLCYIDSDLVLVGTCDYCSWGNDSLKTSSEEG